MVIALHTLVAPRHKRRRRVGRGNASGRGTYAGRGQKGQRARSGGRKGLHQKALRALFQRLPKHGGFQSLKPKAAVVTLRVIERHFVPGDTVTPAALRRKGLVSRPGPVKILRTGTLTHPLTIRGCEVSAGARVAIIGAGGSFVE